MLKTLHLTAAADEEGRPSDILWTFRSPFSEDN